MTPRVLDVHLRGYELRREEIDRQQYYLGCYFYKALDIVLGNMMRPQGKPAENYLDRPFMQPQDTEEEKLEKEIQQAIRNEQLWIADARMKGLPETIINI